MADSAAVRQRRHRQHAADDHSQCRGPCNPSGNGNGSTQVDTSHDVENAIGHYLTVSPPETADEAVYAALMTRLSTEVDASATTGGVRTLQEAFRVYRHMQGDRRLFAKRPASNG